MNQDYTTAIGQLNTEQKQAVNIIDGAVMVVAGPGTGKTQILAARIATMLMSKDHQINPANILCLTYTDAGVVAMRSRLIDFMGPIAYKVNIHTFHSFCNNVVQWNLDYFGVRDVEAVTDLEVMSIMYEIIDEMPTDSPLKRLKGDIYYESSRLKDLFWKMKEENWDYQFIGSKVGWYLADLPNREEFIYKRANAKKGIHVGDLKTIAIKAEEEKMSKLVTAAALLTEYNAKLRERKRYDYADMIGWVTKAFSDSGEFLMEFQEKYQYILVDEFQDTNGSQHELLRLLIDFWDNPNVFVVGDEDQSIFEFSGARIQNISEFGAEYSPSLVLLKSNYRSTQEILDASKLVIDNNKIRLAGDAKTLVSEVPYIEGINPDVPFVVSYENIIEEEMTVVDQIKDLIASGYQPREIAVIYRKHRQSEEIIKELTVCGIPVTAKKRIDVMYEVRVRQVVAMINYIMAEVIKPHSGESLLFEILHYDFWNIPRSTIEAMSVEIYRHRKDELKWRNCLAGTPAITILESLISDYHNLSIVMVLEKLINETGLVKKLVSGPTKEQDMLVINTFFNWVKGEIFKNPGLNGCGLVDLIGKMMKEGFQIPIHDVNFHEEGGVNLLTCHGSKGLEFSHVFMIGCTMNEWEKSRGNVNKYKLPDNITHSQGDDAMESNRRLFYVSMTRAKESLYISYAKKNNDGKNLEATQFIEESGLKIVNNDSTPDLAEHLLLRMSTPVMLPQLDKHIIDRALEDYRLSVSHLNKYLDCPIAFYYENILRIPFVASEPLIFGNAVHYAMKKIYDFWKREKELPSSEWFIMEFTHDLIKNKGQMTSEALSRRTILGEQILPGYYNDHIIGSNKVTLTEYKIQNVTISGVPVKGDIDKLEFDGARAVIVDYKTGKVKYALKEMKGPKKEGDLGGNYWRQGIFYGLMLNNQKNSWTTQGVRFELIDQDFIGPVNLEIGPNDAEIVKKQITETYNSIMNHEFSQGCGKEDCQWCEFQKNQ